MLPIFSNRPWPEENFVQLGPQRSMNTKNILKKTKPWSVAFKSRILTNYLCSHKTVLAVATSKDVRARIWNHSSLQFHQEAPPTKTHSDHLIFFTFSSNPSRAPSTTSLFHSVLIGPLTATCFTLPFLGTTVCSMVSSFV